MHYALLHLPTAAHVFTGWYIEEVENFFDRNFFYIDPTDHTISYDMYEKGDLEMVIFDPVNNRTISCYWLVPLNKCEFDIVEVY